jgi:hypothetical protein
MSKLISTIVAAAVAASSFNAFAGSHAVGAPADPNMQMPAPAVVQQAAPQAPMASPAIAKPMKSMKAKKAGKKAKKAKKSKKAKKGMKKSKRAQR